MSKTLYISNFIKTFRKELKLPDMTMQDLARMLYSMGCHKTPDKMYYEDEVFNILYMRTNELKREYCKLHPEKCKASNDAYKAVMDANNRACGIKPNNVKTPDETDMDYVSNQLLKDDGVFYESAAPKQRTVRFIRKRTSKELYNDRI